MWSWIRNGIKIDVECTAKEVCWCTVKGQGGKTAEGEKFTCLEYKTMSITSEIHQTLQIT